MSVIKVLRDLNGLFNYSTDENPTSQQDYQKAVKNWVKTIVSLVDAVMWQPETEYNVSRAINAEVFKPCGCQTVTVRNTSNIPILVQNANIIFSRPDLAVTR